MKTRLLLILALTFCMVKAIALPPETSYVANIAYKATGSAIDDVSYGPFNVGFTFNFFGNNYTQFYVSSNGLITFGSGSSVYSNVCIPSSGAPNNMICAFWDDIMIDGTGAIYFQTIGAAPNRKLIVQWTNMTMYGSPVLMGTFTAILYETSNNVQIQYRSIVDPLSGQPHGNSATIGLENSAGTSGVQLYCNQAGVVDSEKAFLFTQSGATYTTNVNATYEGVLLVEATPYPGIPGLITPANNATVATSTNFQWSAATNATTYSLQISDNSDLSSSTATNAGTNLNVTPTAFSTGVTKYWAVWATNSAGTTWSEIRKLTTSATPPLAAVPQTYYVELTQDVTISMSYSGGDANSKTAIITSLPTDGALYQYNNGVKGSQITTVPTTLTDANMRVIYTASGTSGNGKGNFNFKIHDGTGDSPVAALTLNVSPLGAPNFLNASKTTTTIELNFDRLMADPTGKQAQFTVSDGSGAVTVSSAALKSGDNYTILLTMGRTLTGTVNISYTAGTIASAVGGLLLSFTSQIVALTSQTITFNALAAKNYGDAPFTLSASASSGLTVTYTSSNTSVATISGSTCTLTGSGTTTITASQAGNGTYAPASYSQVLTVNKTSQTITFNALSAKNVGDADYSPAATASSGLTVTYASSNTAVATIVSGNIHIVAPGTTTITASQAGNGTYNAAADITQNLTVNKQSQTITFGALTAKTLSSADFAPGATASSGLTVSYASSNTAVATIVSNQIHIVGVGSSTITASQAGNATYSAATDVNQTLTVNKNSQTITFGAIANKAYGIADFDPGATASSGLVVSYASSNPAVASIVSNQIHILGVGTATITASQAGNGNYNAATDATQTLTVIKGSQTITFGALSAKTFGDADSDPGATSNSGLTVTYSSDNTAVATIVSGKIHIISSGTAQITASQTGNANYNAAPNVSQSFTVNKANQAITFGSIPLKVFGDPDFSLDATSNSGLGVSYSSGNTLVATIVSGNIHIIGAGTAVITALQTGDGNYNAASNVTQTLTVNKKDQSITFGSLSTKLPTDPDFDPGANSNSGLTVSYSSGNTSVATIVSGKIHLLGVGTTLITASQAGNSNFNPATSIDQLLTVEKLDQSITFNPLPSKGYGSSDYDPGATTSSGLPITYSSDNLSVASIVAGKIHLVGIGTANIKASQGGNATYNPASDVTVTLEVTKATLTITADNKVKIYGDNNPTLTVSYSGFIGSDNETQLSVLPQLNVAATQSSGAGTYTITASGASADNYNITYADGILTVNKKVLTITTDNKSKVYGEGNPDFTIHYAGFYGSDNEDLIISKPIATSVATENSDVGTYPIIPADGNDVNYSFSYVNGELSITKKQLIAKADNQGKSYGDPNPALTITYSGFVNNDDPSVIDTPPSLSTTAVALSAVGNYPISISGGSDNNYTFSNEPGTLTINLRTLVVNIKDASKIYGDPNPALIFTYSGFVGTDDESVLDQLPVISTTANELSNVGDYVISGSGGSDNFYTFFYNNGQLTIHKKEILATAENKTKVYGEANPEFTFLYSGFVNGESASVIDNLPVGITTATEKSIVGSYTITPSAGFDHNYSFSYEVGNLSITKKDIIATADNKKKAYGDLNPEFTITYTGLVNEDDPSLISGEPVISTIADEHSIVGEYPITLSGGYDDNYTILSLVNGTLTVEKKQLVVTADDKSKVYGTENPDFTFNYTGFSNQESSSVLTVTPSVASNATKSSPVGVYPIEVAGGTADNYSFEYVNGSLTVTKKELTIKAEEKYKVVNDINPSFTFNYSGFENDDNPSALSTLPQGATTATESSAVGDYDIIPFAASADNYSFIYVNGILRITSIAGDKNGDGFITPPEIAGDKNCDGTIILPEIAGDLNGDGKITAPEMAGDKDGDGKITSPEIAGDLNGDGDINSPELAGDIDGNGLIESPEFAGDKNGDGMDDSDEIVGDLNGDGKITAPEIAGDINGDGKIINPEIAGDVNGDGKITAPEILGDINGDGKITAPEIVGDKNGDGIITTPEFAGDKNGNGIVDPSEIVGDSNGDGKITSPEVAGDTNGDGKITSPELAGDTNGDGKITSPELAGDINGDGKITSPEVAGDTNGDGKITSPEVTGDTNGDGKITSPEVAGDTNGDGKITSPEVAGDTNGDGKITSPELAGDTNGDGKITSPEQAGDTNGDGKIISPEVAGDTNGDGKITSPEVAGDTNGDGKITSPEVAGDTNGDGKITSPEVAGDTNGDGKITSPEIAGDTNGDGQITSPEVAGDINGDGQITSPEVAGDTNGDGKITSPEVAGDTNGDGEIISPEILGDTNGNGKIDSVEIAGDTNGDAQINSTEVRVIDPAKDHGNVDHLFSPNTDGINDYWKLPKIELYGRVQVKIYNRWGGLVYESSNYQNDWDGTSNGKPVPEGAYFYFLKTEKDGDKSGVINIVR